MLGEKPPALLTFGGSTLMVYMKRDRCRPLRKRDTKKKCSGALNFKSYMILMTQALLNCVRPTVGIIFN